MPSPCDELGATPAHLVLHVLSTKSRRSKKGVCVYDVQTLSHDIGVDDPRPVQLSLEELTETGAVRVLAERTVHVAEPCTCDDQVFSCSSAGVFSYSSEERADSSIPHSRPSKTRRRDIAVRSARTQPAGLSSSDRSRQVNDGKNTSTRGWDGGRTPAAKARLAKLERPPVEWDAGALSTYFARESSKCPGIRMPGRYEVNFPAMGATFKRWMSKDNIRPDEIKRMIDWFCADPMKYLVRGSSLWQSFLKKYRQIWADSSTFRDGAVGEEKRDDETHWLPTPEQRVEQSEEYWLGARR